MSESGLGWQLASPSCRRVAPAGSGGNGILTSLLRPGLTTSIFTLQKDRPPIDSFGSTVPVPRSLSVNASGEPVGGAQASNDSSVVFLTTSVTCVCLASTTMSCKTTSESDSSGSWSSYGCLWAWAPHG